MGAMKLNELRDISHTIAKEKGFWDEGRSFAEVCMLIVTEISEAVEKDREGNYEGMREELADTFIRLGDLCGFINMDIEKEVERKTSINKDRPYKHGKRY